MRPAEPFALPPDFAARMAAQLGADYAAFVAALAQPAPVSVRFNPTKVAGPLPPAQWAFGQQTLPLEPLPWQPQAAFLPQRPVFALDPAWHAGAYYVQEASSMLVGLALDVLRGLSPPDQPLHVLDLCAAPGGKTTLLADALRPECDVLVANEAVQSRMGLLLENLLRWGAPHVVGLQHDPDTLAMAGLQFDLVLADAPCSGEGLWRRDPDACLQWSPQAVTHCAARQQRVLHAAWQMVRPGGLLLYSTCTFAPDENEHNIRHLLAQHPDLAVLPLAVQPDWGLTAIDLGQPHPAYAALPHRTRGEGFFCCLMHKADDAPPPAAHTATEPPSRRPKPGKGSKPDRAPRPKPTQRAPLLPYLQPHAQQYVWADSPDGRQWITPPAVADLLGQWPQRLHIARAGVEVGTVKGRDALPAHALALCPGLLAQGLPAVDLDLPQALQYLRGLEPQTEPHLPTGWYLVRYHNINLGWLKYLGSRSNNYYPKNYRLRMQSDGPA